MRAAIHKYSEQEKAFLRDSIKGRSYEDLRQLFNDQFGLSLTRGQMIGTIKRLDLQNGRDCKFQPGHESFNKGRKGVSYPGMKPTQFKKGNRPHNYRPVGSERATRDGYLEVKVADPKKWRAKHVLVWEAEHGPVPKGHALIFGDGNRLNVDIDKLILVTRGELAFMNKRGLVGKSVELTQTGKAIANVVMKMTGCKRKAAGTEQEDGK